VPTGRSAGPGAASRGNGPWSGLCRGDHSFARRRHLVRGIQHHRHAGERKRPRQTAAAAAAAAATAAAAAAAELEPVVEPAEAEAAPDPLHPGAAQRAGAELR